MERRSTSLVKGAAILGLAGIICKIIGVLFRIWAYGIIGEEGMVFYEIVFPFYSWLLILSSSGLPIAISRMVSERAAVGDFAGARKVFQRSLLALLVLGLVSTCVLFFGADFISTGILQLSPDLAISFRCLAPALLFVSLLCAYRGYLQGMQLMTGTGVSQIAEQVFKCVIGLYLASLWIVRSPAWGAAGTLIGVSASEALALGVMMIFTLKHKRQLLPLGCSMTPKNSSQILSTMVKIALPITIGASILPLTSMLDIKMIYSIMGKYLSESAIDSAYVALSTNVRSLINLPASLTTALAISIVPTIAASRARKDENGVKLASQLGLKLSMVVGLPCAAGLFVLGGPVIQMLFRSISPESLEIATRIMRFASISVIFISLVQTMTGALQGVGKQRLPVYFLAAGAAAKIITNLVLLRIPEVGIVGASISNIACYAVAGILDAIALCRVIKLKPNIAGCFIKPLTASLIMGELVFFVYKLLYALHPGTLVTLVSVIVGIVAYLLLLFALRVFTPQELSYIPGGARLKRFYKR